MTEIPSGATHYSHHSGLFFKRSTSEPRTALYWDEDKWNMHHTICGCSLACNSTSHIKPISKDLTSVLKARIEELEAGRVSVANIEQSLKDSGIMDEYGNILKLVEED